MRPEHFGISVANDLEIFYNAYVYLKFGTAIAMAWVLGFLLIGLTMFQMKRISRMNFTAGDND